MFNLRCACSATFTISHPNGEVKHEKATCREAIKTIEKVKSDPTRYIKNLRIVKETSVDSYFLLSKLQATCLLECADYLNDKNIKKKCDDDCLKKAETIFLNFIDIHKRSQ